MHSHIRPHPQAVRPTASEKLAIHFKNRLLDGRFSLFRAATYSRASRFRDACSTRRIGTQDATRHASPRSQSETLLSQTPPSHLPIATPMFPVECSWNIEGYVTSLLPSLASLPVTARSPHSPSSDDELIGVIYLPGNYVSTFEVPHAV